MATQITDEELFATCLDSAYYNYDLEIKEEETDGYDEFVKHFGELYGAARQRYQGKSNKELFYKKEKESVSLFGKLYDKVLMKFTTDDILEFMGNRYESMEKMKIGTLEFLSEYPDISNEELADKIVNDLVERRVRPMHAEIIPMLKHPKGDPFYFICDALRFAIVPFLDAAQGKKTKYGDKYPEAMMKLFEDTVVTIVDGAIQLFKNNLQGVEKYIKVFMKGHQKTSGKNAQFNEMMGNCGASIVIDKYCKARGIHYVCDNSDYFTMMDQMKPMMGAMNSIHEIVRDFPMNEEEKEKDTNDDEKNEVVVDDDISISQADNDLMEDCLNLCMEDDYFYTINMNGTDIHLFESMNLNDLASAFKLNHSIPQSYYNVNVPSSTSTMNSNVDEMKNDEEEMEFI